jgi:hypothetical protein
VIEDELPGEKHGRFVPFLAGAAVFTGPVLLIQRFLDLE